MPGDKIRQPANPSYALLREGRFEEFNRKRQAAETPDLRGCDFRGLDLRPFDLKNLDLSDCYFRQADLRGQDLRECRLHGASLHAARVSGVYFPQGLAPTEIEMSVRLGTRMRYG